MPTNTTASGATPRRETDQRDTASLTRAATGAAIADALENFGAFARATDPYGAALDPLVRWSVFEELLTIASKLRAAGVPDVLTELRAGVGVACVDFGIGEKDLEAVVESDERGRLVGAMLLANANRIEAERAPTPDPDTASTASEDETEAAPRRQFPDPPAAAVYHGPLGDLVRIVEPHSEADPVAILVHALAYLGVIVGRTGHLVAEARKHFGNLFVGVVAATSKGRKGSAGAQVERVFRLVDGDFMKTQKTTGLSSGEGLIWTVRDEIRRTEPIKEKGRVTGYQEVVVDPGIADKRELFVEEELGGMLSVMGREGNSLSPTIRQAWDTGDLNTAVKNNPARATGALVSIVGHVTAAELRRNLDDTSKTNGFANRFVWICARRSKALPFGGRLTDEDLVGVVGRLRAAVDFARNMGERRLTWSHEAAERWRAVYPALSDGRPGLLGSVTSRAEAQCVRLALIYALADRSEEIGLPHLEAALGLWSYAEASARFTFGDALGDPLADELLRLLRRAGAEGMSRSAIRESFSRNRASDEITRGLETLAEAGLARMGKPEPAPGQRGRRPETWYAVNAIDAVIQPDAAIPASTAFTAYPSETDGEPAATAEPAPELEPVDEVIL